MKFKELKKIYGLSNAEMARIFGLKNAQAFATSSAKNRMEKAVENLSEILFKKNMYTVAEVQNQVTGNYIAWATPISHHESLEEAREAARQAHNANMNEGIEGIVIFIHDGENYY